MKSKGRLILILVSMPLFGCAAAPTSSGIGSSHFSPSSLGSFVDETAQGEGFFALGEAYVDGSGASATVESVSLSHDKMTIVADIECVSASVLQIPSVSFTRHYGGSADQIQNLLSSTSQNYAISWIYGYELDIASTNALYGAKLVSADGFVPASLAGRVSFVFDVDADLAAAVGAQSLSAANMFFLSPLPPPTSNLTYYWHWSFSDIALK